MLDAQIRTTAGAFHLDVDLQAASGEVVAILGPNGAGKSTLLRALAGLAGGAHVVLDGVELDDLPPEGRPIGVVFQDHLLFPHLDALDNVAFGMHGRRSDRRAAAAAWLHRVGLADRASARPAELSGGQAQRVALARTLAREPALLLLDEPLAALDAGTRNDMRRELHRHLAAYPGIALLVTHDAVDAFALADRLLVLEGGRVVQEGAPAEVAAAPRSRYVAELIGTNLIAGTARDGVVRTATGGVLVTTTAEDGEVLAVVAPAAVSLHRRQPEGSPRNVWQGTVAAVDRLVDRVRVEVDGPIAITAEVTEAAADELALQRGDTVWVAIKATEISVNRV